MASDRSSGPRSLAQHALAKTGLPEAVRDELEAIRAELDASYRERFLEMTQALQRQASALDRLTNTLELLVEKASPELKGRVPGLVLADPGENPDLATIAADPIGAGYYLTQQDLARALHATQTDISILVNALNLKDNPELAVVVRRGKKREVVNYHRRAVDHLTSVFDAPPRDLSKAGIDAVRRIKAKRNARGHNPA